MKIDMRDPELLFLLACCSLRLVTTDELPSIAEKLVAGGADHSAILKLATHAQEPDARNFDLMQKYLDDAYPDLWSTATCVSVYVREIANKVRQGRLDPVTAIELIVETLIKTKVSTADYQHFLAVAYDCDQPGETMEVRCSRAVDRYLAEIALSPII